VEEIQDILLSIRKLVSMARNWSSTARDALCALGPEASIVRLEKLQAEAAEMPIIVDERDALISTIQQGRNWIERAQKALAERSEVSLITSLLKEVCMIPFLQQLTEYGQLRSKMAGATSLSRLLRDILQPKRNRIADASKKLSFSKVSNM
jgi:hypothetical protein